MAYDLDKQRSHAVVFADVLKEFVPTDEITEDLILDALGVCGLVLQEGEDAGKAWLDGIIEDIKNERHKGK